VPSSDINEEHGLVCTYLPWWIHGLSCGMGLLAPTQVQVPDGVRLLGN